MEHGANANRKSWLELKLSEEAELGRTRQPYCVMVGGGQGGIALAARLKRLELPTIVLERNARACDILRNRYQSLFLHDPVWYDHLPYLPFPDHWPVFSPKDKLGDWLEMYVKVMELNYWTCARCLAASYDAEAKAWSVLVDRNGERITLAPKQLVLATGMSGFPEVPTLTELGISGADVPIWFSVFAPAGTPKDIIAKFNAKIVEIGRTEDMQAKMLAVNAVVPLQTPEEMAAHLAQDIKANAELIQAALGQLPLAGFFAQGELGPIGGRNFIHGFTASLVLFEGG